MKIAAVILSVLGIGLTGVAAYGYFLSSDYELCQRQTAVAEGKLNEARAAQGTSREAELNEEATLEVDSQERLCRYWKQTQQSVMLFGLGGVSSIIVGALLIIISLRRRNPAA